MVCTDICEQSLNICQKRLPKAKCILVNQNDAGIPCENLSASLILCIEVRPIIQSKWLPKECSRVLKTNGIIVGVYWNQFSLRGLFAHIKAFLTGGCDYYKKSYFKLKKSFKENGFRFIYESGYCWFPFKRDSNSKLISSFSSMEEKLGLRKLVNISPWVVFVAQKQ